MIPFVPAVLISSFDKSGIKTYSRMNSLEEMFVTLVFALLVLFILLRFAQVMLGLSSKIKQFSAKSALPERAD